MIKALYTSATGLTAQQTVVDNTANNLANVNTNGFKKGLVDFQDLIYVTERSPGTEASQGLQFPTGLQLGSGARVAGITKIFSQGDLVNTGNPLDVSINGQGFFQINLPSGDIRYSRDGAFKRDSTGKLVTSDGFRVQPEISIPDNAKDVTIGSDGTVSVTTATAATATNVGQLTLTRFANPSGLNAEGRNLFSETPASGTPLTATPGQNGAGLLQQGFQERSNVDVVTEMVNLILAQRAYEFNLRSIKTSDEMLSNTTNVTR